MTDSANSFTDNRLNARQQLQWELLTSLGIISQLMEDRARQTFPEDLPRPLFSILSHMTRLGGDKTVTDLARAFQVPQPGMTKSVQKLLDRGYLRAEVDPEDARRKRLFMTGAGSEAYFAALKRLAPDADLIFAEWELGDMQHLQAHLFRLRRWLDTHRTTFPDMTKET